MKKIVTFILAIALCAFVPSSFSGCTPREEILRIYNWGDYMDKATYKDFEDWYKEKTGESVKVVYKTFDKNETMYTEIVKKGSDYDLICPSDYMLERMLNEGKIKPLSQQTQAIANEAVYGGLRELISYDSDLQYSMPYIWGTFGIMYNAKSAGFSTQAMSSWSALFPLSGAEDKIYMKDSVRDSYTVAMLYDNADELNRLRQQEGGYDNEEYQALLTSIFSEIDQDKIDRAEQVLKAQKKYVKGYEVDEAKNDMSLDENGDRKELGLFWSCDAGYVMSEAEESGYSCGGGGNSGVNKNLRYVVPVEGSNVWVDSFAIPSTAVNEKAANYFIQYLCEKQTGYDCMVYTGGTSAVEASMEMYKEELDEEGNEFFADAPDGFKEMYLSMMFPSVETLKRCAIMKDFPEFNSALDDMWDRVLGS